MSDVLRNAVTGAKAPAIRRRAPAAIGCALAIAFSTVGSGGFAAESAPATFESKPSKAPRELYNAGTWRLHEGKLKEAQDLLRSAAESNHESVMPDALFNLGHTRYRMGDQELKRLLQRQNQLQEVPRRANQSAQAATLAAQQALAGGNVDELVAAYRRGQGARRELRAAREAVRQALQQLGFVLSTWQRASADFRGAHELRPTEDASFNAELMDQRIAALIDMIRKQQEMIGTPSQSAGQLGEAMRQMRGRIPHDELDKLGGDDGDEEEGEGAGDQQSSEQPQAGSHGSEPTSQEQAEQLLRSMQLDSQKVLPQGRPGAGRPARRAGGDW